VLHPAKRTYPAERQTTSEAGIHAAWSGDLYAVLGDRQASGGYTVRLYFHPLVRLIWIGAVIMSLGGVLSLSDRRLRVGAPGRARRPLPAAE
jgi:cytochrome c-type biogenesis protein CcmF